MQIPGVRSIESSNIRKIKVSLEPQYTNGHDFCELLIDEDNGRFTAVLYGGESYTYVFSSKGEKFVKFLIGVFINDPGYLYGKLFNPQLERNCDAERTEKNMKARLLEDRRKNDVSEEQAREVFDRISEMFQGEDETSWDFFYSQYFDGILDNYFGPEPFHDDFLVSTYDYKCHVFCRKVAPILSEVLKEEYQLEI